MSRRVSSEETLACRRSMAEGLSDLRPGARVVVACSGGADSLALVAAAVWVGGRAELAVSAVVVDHALQSNSHEVADAAASTCDLLGAPASIVRVDVGTEGGPEAAARAALSLLREMHDLSLTADVASSAAARTATLVPVDLWDPAQQLRRLQAQQHLSSTLPRCSSR